MPRGRGGDGAAVLGERVLAHPDDAGQHRRLARVRPEFPPALSFLSPAPNSKSSAAELSLSALALVQAKRLSSARVARRLHVSERVRCAARHARFAALPRTLLGSHVQRSRALALRVVRRRRRDARVSRPERHRAVGGRARRARVLEAAFPFGQRPRFRPAR